MPTVIVQKAWVLNEDDQVYVASVKSILKMNLIVKFVTVGVSFRQASRIYQSAKEKTGMGMLRSISEADVAFHSRFVLCNKFSVPERNAKECLGSFNRIDAGNKAGTAYLDLRMQCYFRSTMQNLHLVAMPMRERNTGEYQSDLIVAALDVLEAEWSYQLIGVATDGASAIAGCIQGTCTRLEREYHTPIFPIWCGAYQLDLVIKKAFNRLFSDKFLTTVTAVSGHLRRQPNL
jgi:hypothetical protein